MRYPLGLSPKLIKEWHPTKNGNLDPHKIAPYCNKKVWWQCKNGHEWPARISCRTKSNKEKGSGCPYCNKLTTDDNNLCILFPEIAKQWHPTKNGNLTPYDVTPMSNKRIWWQCPEGHEWPTYIYNRTLGKNCPYCSGRFATKENNLAILYPEIAKQWHPIKNGNLTPYDVTPMSDKRVWWQCEKGHEWKTKVNVRTRGHNCRYCSGQQASQENNLAILYPEIAKQWHPTKNGNLTPYDVTSGSGKIVWWQCPKEHEWKASIDHRTRKKNGTGCSRCSKRISKNGTKWLDSLSINTREFFIIINKQHFVVDGIDINNKTIYEFLGDYWHGNPNNYDTNNINPNAHITYGELFCRTMKKFNILYNAGYSIIYRWESDKTDTIYIPT